MEALAINGKVISIIENYITIRKLRKYLTS